MESTLGSGLPLNGEAGAWLKKPWATRQAADNRSRPEINKGRTAFDSRGWVISMLRNYDFAGQIIASRKTG